MQPFILSDNFTLPDNTLYYSLLLTPVLASRNFTFYALFAPAVIHKFHWEALKIKSLFSFVSIIFFIFVLLGVFFPYNWDTVSLVGFLKRRKVLGIYIDIEKAWEAKTSNIRRCCICYRKFLRALWSLARQAKYGVK